MTFGKAMHYVTNTQDLLPPVPLAQYKKRDHSTISTAMNQTRTYLVSAVIILSELGITDQPVFGRRTWHSYDAEEDKRLLEFVSILLRLVRHGLGLRRLLEERLAIIDVNQAQSKPWSKFPTAGRRKIGNR
ncbi:hypothetical protein EV424DRAFT_1554002 [Suillus variegatus]|nr:hypothetical protein EV424DRAFT_1554002 [Suillus variegatus]